MKLWKRMFALLLCLVLCLGALPGMASAEANLEVISKITAEEKHGMTPNTEDTVSSGQAGLMSSAINIPPNPLIEFDYSPSVSTGTIRYISQLTSSPYFYDAYWGGWKSQAGIECGTSCISMALSYVGVNRTPEAILTPYNGVTMFVDWDGATHSYPSIYSGMENYLNGAGKYSPLVIRLPGGGAYNPGTGTYSDHYVVLIGKASETEYYVLDPAVNSVGSAIVSGSNVTYRSKSYSISEIHQWYNESAVHTHTYERGYEAAHPHKVYMKCSGCGYYEYTGETTTMPGCSQCNTSDSDTWLWPVKDCYFILSNFGLRDLYGTGEFTDEHRGIDIGSSDQHGWPVYATKSGEIYYGVNDIPDFTFSTTENTAGNYTCIDHGDGTFSIYMHMQPGNRISGSVNQGDVIGYIGQTGWAYGPHLHFQLYTEKWNWRYSLLNPMPTNPEITLLNPYVLPDGWPSQKTTYTFNYQGTHNPTGTVDSITGGAGVVSIRGWAFDYDDISSNLEIHVYIGGPAGTGEGIGGIIADKYRPDVNEAYHVGNFHGYEASIPTAKTGEQTVYVYAINVGGGQNIELGHTTVTINEAHPTYIVKHLGADGKVWYQETIKNGMYEDGTAYPLVSSYPYKNGCYFSGWSYTSDAETPDLFPGETFAVVRDTTLYPVYVTHEKALSDTVIIYNINDFNADGFTVETIQKNISVRRDASHWSEWSAYSPDTVEGSETVKVRTAPMFRYYYFLCPSCGAHEPFSGTSDCGAAIPADAWHVCWSTTSYASSNYQRFSYTTAKYYTTSLGDGQLWVFSAGNLNDTAVGTTDADPSGSGVVIQQGYSHSDFIEEYTTLNKTVTAYRITQNAVQTYIVTYDANGGTGAPAAQTKTQGQPLTLSTVRPTRDGYEFLGWAESKTATAAQYQPGGSFTKDADTTLYAVWNETSSGDLPTLFLENKSVAPGEIVTLDVVLTEPIMAKALLFYQFEFDRSALTLIKGEWKLNNAIIANWDTEEEIASAAFAQNMQLEGGVFSLTFQVKDNANGTYRIGLSPIIKVLSGTQETELEVDFQPGTLNVSPHKPGDANGDGAVTSDDAIYLLYHCFFPDVYPVTQSCDFNGDGAEDDADAIYLLYHVFFPDLYPIG